MNRAVLFLLGFIFGVGFYAIVINTKIKFVERAESQEPPVMHSQANPEELEQLLSASDDSLQQALSEIQEEQRDSPAVQQIEKASDLIQQAKKLVDEQP